jgi:4-hydroxy-3-polyprenylbenzoate decarboxylase
MKLLVAVTGASGSLYAQRLLQALADARVDATVSFSDKGREVWTHEIGSDPQVPFPIQAANDFRSPFASGSALWDGVVVMPCSTGRMARIAQGQSEDLISRAADVALKERRKLILVVRETPLSLLHIENMATLTRAGAVILPACPSFYFRPSTPEALADTVVARVLDQLGIAHQLSQRWGQNGAPKETP